MTKKGKQTVQQLKQNKVKNEKPTTILLFYDDVDGVVITLEGNTKVVKLLCNRFIGWKYRITSRLVSRHRAISFFSRVLFKYKFKIQYSVCSKKGCYFIQLSRNWTLNEIFIDDICSRLFIVFKSLSNNKILFQF